MPNDDSICIIPECSQSKHVDENGMVHDYCGKTHANLGKLSGVLRKFWLSSCYNPVTSAYETLTGTEVEHI